MSVVAGTWYTVGLRANSTVVAVGKNDDGRCNYDWQDIVAVASGSDHTVGLKADGTVVTAGKTVTASAMWKIGKTSNCRSERSKIPMSDDKKQTSKKKLEDVYTSEEDLKEYLSQKAKSHNNYKSYISSYGRLLSCIQENAIFLSDGRKWNDTQDSNNFKNWSDTQDSKDSKTDTSKWRNFGLCFSFSQSESVAMWMLYGGTQHRGVMVDFKRSHIKKLLEDTEEIQCGHWGDNVFTQEKTLSKSKGEFRIFITDVLYYSCLDPELGCDRIKRSDEIVIATPNKGDDVNEKTIKDGVRRDLQKIIKCPKFIKKSYPWSYENECRLIVSVPEDQISEKTDCIKIVFSEDVYGHLRDQGRIYKSPNFKDNSNETKDLTPSTLTDKMNWDLCQNCKYPKTGRPGNSR